MKAKRLSLTFMMALLTVAAIAGGKTQVIAHRGHWTVEGSAQNSRTSLQLALDMGIYGSEIDIWLTADGKLMVNHDESYDGVTIRKAKAKQCKKLVLKNGERMPQLKDMLKLLKKSKTPTKLIIEIKSAGDKEADIKAARETMRQVRKRHLESKVDYISFSLEACKELVRIDPTANVAYLSGNLSPVELRALGLNGMDYHISALRKNPQWIKEAHDLDMEVNVWTVDSKEEMEEMKAAGVDYITTNQPERCVAICEK